MTKMDDFLDQVSDMNPEAGYPTGMQKAIVGYIERFGLEPLIVLSRKKCLDILMTQGMSYDEAIEYFDFNIIGAWMGEGTPAFLTTVNEVI